MKIFHVFHQKTDNVNRTITASFLLVWMSFALFLSFRYHLIPVQTTQPYTTRKYKQPTHCPWTHLLKQKKLLCTEAAL